MLGPSGLTVLEHVLDVLAPHPADIVAKLEAFARLNAITAVFVQNELAGGSAAQRRNARLPAARRDLGRAPAARPAARPAPATTGGPEDRYADILTRVLTALLGPPPRT